MAIKVDYYELLEITREASDDEIKRAFRQKVRSCHPDRCPGDSEAESRFKLINEAYTVLSDPNKRMNYDRFGDPEGGSAMGGDFFGGFADLFDVFMGGSRTAAQSGDDRHLRLTLSLEEAATGCEKQISYTRETLCSECNGSGGDRSATRNKCERCGGQGFVRRQRQTIFGMTSVQTEPCTYCSGRGYTFSKQCETCNGTGHVHQTEEQKIKIPAGVADGMTLRIAGGGDAGVMGGPQGDLLVTIHIMEHPRFIQEGVDLYAQVTLPLSTAVCGGKIAFETLIDGEVELKVDQGTVTGTTQRFVGKGMPILRHGRRGDLYVQYHVEIPKWDQFTSEQQKLFAQLFNHETVQQHDETSFMKKLLKGKKKKSKS